VPARPGKGRGSASKREQPPRQRWNRNVGAARRPFGAHLWGKLSARAEVKLAAKAGWSLAAHSHPAFAVNQLYFHVKTETYEIIRHPEVVLRWADQDEKPVAELEIYRPGGESGESGAAPPPTSADSVTGAQNPDLRGAL
jgi:hypothetical protein